MIFIIDRRLNYGSWIDYSMFLKNIMIAACVKGLRACPQVAFAPYHGQFRLMLGIAENLSIRINTPTCQITEIRATCSRIS